MMKSVGHALLSSFKPPYCFTPKNCHRLPSSLICGITKSRNYNGYHQKHHSRSKFEMGAEQYLPPWFSVAPMMEWTDNHYRTMARLITKHAWLYTEMLAAETIVYQEKNLDRFLAFSPDQHPIVLQIGGNNLENLAKATRLANSYGYDEINLNCGCPSPKVAGHGCFGVSLMLDPKDYYEATAEINDLEPCMSLTIRLLSLQTKGCVYIDEVYVLLTLLTPVIARSRQSMQKPHLVR